jgi:hypothetical protein
MVGYRQLSARFQKTIEKRKIARVFIDNFLFCEASLEVDKYSHE